VEWEGSKRFRAKILRANHDTASMDFLPPTWQSRQTANNVSGEEVRAARDSIFLLCFKPMSHGGCKTCPTDYKTSLRDRSHFNLKKGWVQAQALPPDLGRLFLLWFAKVERRGLLQQIIGVVPRVTKVALTCRPRPRAVASGALFMQLAPWSLCYHWHGNLRPGLLARKPNITPTKSSWGSTRACNLLTQCYANENPKLRQPVAKPDVAGCKQGSVWQLTDV
jgi:hypothetical protein